MEYLEKVVKHVYHLSMATLMLVLLSSLFHELTGKHESNRVNYNMEHVEAHPSERIHVFH